MSKPHNHDWARLSPTEMLNHLGNWVGPISGDDDEFVHGMKALATKQHDLTPAQRDQVTRILTKLEPEMAEGLAPLFMNLKKEEDVKENKYQMKHIRLFEHFVGEAMSDNAIQKKIAEINAMIAKAKDADGDLIGVIDKTSTWEAPMYYKPLSYKNGVLYIEYEEYTGRKNEVHKEKIGKSRMELDGIPTLNNIAKMYRAALKKNNISLDELQELTEDDRSHYSHIKDLDEPRPRMVPAPKPEFSIKSAGAKHWDLYLQDQASDVIIDKYGLERGLKNWDYLIGQGGAMFAASAQIASEKMQMLKDLGELDSYGTDDYFKRSYFDIWKEWKAMKTGKPVPPVITVAKPKMISTPPAVAMKADQDTAQKPVLQHHITPRGTRRGPLLTYPRN
jgi:hypothetical protein